MMKVRWYVVVALAGIAAAAAVEYGCHRAAPAAPTDTTPRVSGPTGSTPQVVSVAIRADSTVLSLPGQTSLSAIEAFSNGTSDVISKPLWSSDNTRVATVASNGLVTAIGYGTARISATLPSLPNVPPPTPVEISVIDTGQVLGIYRMTLNTSKSCQLPREAMSRTYTATMSLVQGRIRVTLSGANFWSPRGIVWNMLLVDLHADSVTFKVFDIDFAFYEGGGIAEQLAENEYLAFYGTGEAPAISSSFSATFAGTVSIVAPPLVDDTYNVITTCTAPDHQLVFARVSGLPAVR
jgi:hypothetical protein